MCLIKAHILTADFTVGGGVKEEPTRGVEVEADKHKWLAAGAEFATRSAALVHGKKDVCRAPPDAGAGGIRLLPSPSFMGSHVGEESVRKIVVKNCSMLEGIAPEMGRGLGGKKEATRHLHEELVARLSHPILLRGVREGVGVMDALCGKEGGKSVVEELPTPIRVEALDFAIKQILNLEGPSTDGSGGVALVAKEVHVAKPGVVINNGESIGVALKGLEWGGPQVHVDEIKLVWSTRGVGWMGGGLKLAFNTYGAWRGT